MTKLVAVLIACAATLGCSTSSLPNPERAVATVTVRAITPTAGATIDGDAVIQAEIDYKISNFDPRAEYYLAPLFDSLEGSGHTFNEFQRVEDGWRLTEPVGTVSLRYPIAREWRNPSLARPVRLTFKVMVRTSGNSTSIIGQAEAMQFSSAV